MSESASVTGVPTLARLLRVSATHLCILSWLGLFVSGAGAFGNNMSAGDMLGIIIYRGDFQKMSYILFGV